LNVMAVCLVMAALLAVVVAQAMLANGQVRLSSLQHQLALEQSAHRQAELSVSQLETPSRIVAAATGQLHMDRPNVIQLPYVSLSAPLPTPKVTPAPAPATTPAAGSAAGTAQSATTGSTSTPTGTGTAGAGTAVAGASGTTATSTTTATSIP